METKTESICKEHNQPYDIVCTFCQDKTTRLCPGCVFPHYTKVHGMKLMIIKDEIKKEMESLEKLIGDLDREEADHEYHIKAITNSFSHFLDFLESLSGLGEIVITCAFIFDRKESICAMLSSTEIALKEFNDKLKKKRAEINDMVANKKYVSALEEAHKLRDAPPLHDDIKTASGNIALEKGFTIFNDKINKVKSDMISFVTSTAKLRSDNEALVKENAALKAELLKKAK